jgi:hypothetical protein
MVVCWYGAGVRAATVGAATNVLWKMRMRRGICCRRDAFQRLALLRPASTTLPRLRSSGDGRGRCGWRGGVVGRDAAMRILSRGEGAAAALFMLLYLSGENLKWRTRREACWAWRHGGKAGAAPGMAACILFLRNTTALAPCTHSPRRGFPFSAWLV